ncbi:MAG: hypothetical protein KatS3mg038_1116 [Candidatus Kapaibacterium sp.]|nr:MAG: hypothetical protein KatS3mg038_1116 [Candidatus Kapabacteria bacterium]
MRNLMALFRRRKPVQQSAQLSSLQAGVVHRTLQAASASNHPLRVLCESYYVQSAAVARYYVRRGDVIDYEHPLIVALHARSADIARAYITTGAVLLRRRVDDTLDIVDRDHYTIDTYGLQPIVRVDGNVVAPGTYAIVTWGAREPAHAIAPWEALAIDLALDTAAREYAASTLHMDAYMRRIIVPQSELPGAAARELADSLSATYRAHKGATAVLPIPAQVHEAQPAIADLQLDAISDSVEARVAAVYGIPIQLLGLSASAKHQTYANREQAARDYTRRTLLPYWQRIAQAVSDVWGVTVELDEEAIPELQEDLVDSTVRLVEAGIITIDEARERVNYGPLSAQEQSSDQEMVQLASDDMYYQSVQARYDAVSRALQSAFGDALDTIASKASSMHDAERRVYLYSSEYQEDLRAPILRKLKAEINATINDAYNEARRSGDAYAQDPVALARAESDAIIRELTDDAMRYTGETVRSRILEGATELLSASYVALVANTLATAIVTRLQLATWQAMQRASRKPLKLRKVWLSMRDGKVRSHHQEMDGVSVDLTAKFSVPSNHGTEYADGPGDPQLSAENRINCRCVLRPRRTR